MDLKRCFEKGLLWRTNKDPELAEKDLRRAQFFLGKAERLIRQNEDVIGSIPLYYSFFHCARALLFRDGIRERSHFCIARYLEEEYVKSKKLDVKFLKAFETTMDLRHEVQYSTDPIVIDENLTGLHNLCEEFIEAMRSLCS